MTTLFLLIFIVIFSTIIFSSNFLSNENMKSAGVKLGQGRDISTTSAFKKN